MQSFLSQESKISPFRLSWDLKSGTDSGILSPGLARIILVADIYSIGDFTPGKYKILLPKYLKKLF
jgi:hypothetical protein